MIIRRDQTEVTIQSDGSGNEVESRRVSESGGLTQFGAHINTLQPGGRASDRHWHEREDEFLIVLSGEAVVIEDSCEHVLSPGDAACWPAGEANAHTVVNRSDAPCSYLICGTKVRDDVIRYPDLGQTLHIEGTAWRIVRDHDRAVLKEGYWNEEPRTCRACDVRLDYSNPSDICPDCQP
jgi:uncharacterized cupin superfamily protein